MKKYALGIDLGGTGTKFGLVNDEGKVLRWNSIPTPQYPNIDEYCDVLCEGMKRLVEDEGLTMSDIVGVGCGAPNANFYSGCIEQAPNLPWKGVVPLAKLISERMGVKCTITNDANAANVWGVQNINNTVSAGGKSSSDGGTKDYGEEPKFPVEKTADYTVKNENNGSIDPGDTIKYTVTYGGEGWTLDGTTILDQMSDIQKLTSDVTVTLNKALLRTITWPDGTVWEMGQTSFTMPTGSSQWADDGVVWTDFFDDGQYSLSNDWPRVYSLKLPDGRGEENPYFAEGTQMTVTYSTTVISQEEALGSHLERIDNKGIDYDSYRYCDKCDKHYEHNRHAGACHEDRGAGLVLHIAYKLVDFLVGPLAVEVGDGVEFVIVVVMVIGVIARGLHMRSRGHVARNARGCRACASQTAAECNCDKGDKNCLPVVGLKRKLGLLFEFSSGPHNLPPWGSGLSFCTIDTLGTEPYPRLIANLSVFLSFETE